MTTLRPPLPSAVRVAVPLAPLPFSSTSFAFTVVSAAALIGRHSMAAAAASMSELRNLVISTASGWEHRVLGGDVVSNHSTPISAADVLWTPRHLTRPSVPPHLYIMPGTGSVHTALDLEEG